MSDARDSKEARIERYRRDYDARSLARMLVALEDMYERLRVKKRRPLVQIGDGNTMIVDGKKRR
jgi:hypothetical protein